MALKLITAPAVEPVSSAEAKLHCRVDTTADDTLIAGLILAAREKVESDTGFALITQTWELVLDGFPAKSEIKLPKPPLQSVTSVTYTNSSAVATVYASSNYIVDIDDVPGKIVLKDAASWPSFTPLEVGAVRIRFVCGYGAAGTNVPQRIRQMMLLLIGHWYENREAITITGAIPKDVPLAYESLLWMDRVKVF